MSNGRLPNFIPSDFDPTLPTAVVPSYPGNMTDTRSAFRIGTDAAYCVNSDGTTPGFFTRFYADAATNVLVEVTVTIGASSAQIGATNRATAANRAGITATINGPSNQFFLGRYDVTNSLAQPNLATASFTPSTGTKYRVFLQCFGTNNTAAKAWLRTDAAPTTDLVTPLTYSDSYAPFQSAGVWGAVVLANTGATKLHSVRAWSIDGTFFVPANTASGPSGPVLEAVPFNGTGPYTFQWYSSLAANSGFSAITGATSFSYTDTSCGIGERRWYKCTVTDTGNSNATSTSDPLPATKLLPTLVLGFVGTSWMARDRSAFPGTIFAASGFPAGTIPDLVGRKVARLLNRTVTISNSSVSGSRSDQWVSGQSNMTAALAAFASAGVTHVYVDDMALNDIGTSMSIASHVANMTNICAALVSAGYTVLLGRPGAYVPGTLSGRGIPEIDLLLSYLGPTDAIANGSTIINAANTMTDHFFSFPARLDDDLHPNFQGSDDAAAIIARSFAELLAPNIQASATAGAWYTTLAQPDVNTTHSGTAQAGASTSITLAAAAVATTDYYVGQLVYIDSGTGVGQARVITAYNGTTKVATVDRAWATNPNSGSAYSVRRASITATPDNTASITAIKAKTDQLAFTVDGVKADAGATGGGGGNENISQEADEVVTQA